VFALFNELFFESLPHKRVTHKNGTATWKRPFVYDELHDLNIMVLAADKYTHTTYRIKLRRASPWYFSQIALSIVSQIAMGITTFMSVTSAANFVALTKQMQFMALTKDIKGVPEIYRSFARSMDAFNLDITGLLMQLPIVKSLPTKQKFQEVK
jgi:hypothetical protein